MRLGIVLLVMTLVLLIAICDSKSTKKGSKKSHNHDTKAVKKSHPAKPNESKKTHSDPKTTKNDKKKTKVAVTKTTKKTKVDKKSKSSDKESKKPENDKKHSKVQKDKEKHDKPKKAAEKDSTKPKENLKKVPHNCDEIVEQYANGQMVMYEYKIKMAKCLKGKEATLKSSITSKYEDESGANFFQNAMKYVDDDGSAKDDNDDMNFEDDDSDKKSIVPATDAAIPAATDAAATAMYSTQGFPDQAQNLQQSQAAFTPNVMNNQAAPVQQNYNFFTRSDIPAAAPQVQQPINQWNAPNQDTTKKNTLPAAPADDPFASFMNIQSSQNAAPQQAQQQRSDIPAPVPSPQELQQRSEIPIDASYQAPAAPQYSAIPTNQQAFLRDDVRAWSPEDHGIFPENP